MKSERSVRQELEMKKQVWIHRMKSHMAAVLAGLLTACVLCILVPAGHVFAYSDVDQTKEGSLTISMNGGAGFDFRIYQIGTFGRGVAVFEPTEGLKKLNVDLGDSGKIDLGSGKWDSYAATLANYAHAPYLGEAMSPAETDAGGKALFQRVKPGVYLVLGESRVADGKKYTFSPILISVPTSADGSSWNYDVTAEAKFSTEPVQPEKKIHSWSVTKYWQNDSGTGRPSGIDVTVYRRDLGGSGSFGNWYAWNTYTLSNANNWSVNWVGAENAEYRVSENGTVRNADGTAYLVSISTGSSTDADGTRRTWFALTNRKPIPETPPGETPKQSDEPPTINGSENSSEGATLGTINGAYETLNGVKTGDDAQMNLWLVLFIAAGGVLVLWGIVGLRRK
jgi:hypothetical protein